MSWHDNAARDPSIGPLSVMGRNIGKAAGYSLLELHRAGLSEADAQRLSLALERNRKTLIGCNVMQLRQLAQRLS